MTSIPMKFTTYVAYNFNLFNFTTVVLLQAAHALFRNSKVQHRAKLATVIFTFTFGVFLYVIIPSVLLTFISNEEGWTFVECLYCVFVTLTTIGFGDYVPGNRTETIQIDIDTNNSSKHTLTLLKHC